MIVRPDPLVFRHLAITDSHTLPGTPVTLQPGGVTPSTMLKPDVVGLAITEVQAGDDVTYITNGILELDDWTAITGSATLTVGLFYYLGASFFLTSTPPVTGQLVEIGRAQTDTILDIKIKTPIFLA